jgi:hypothetical protein
VPDLTRACKYAVNRGRGFVVRSNYI